MIVQPKYLVVKKVILKGEFYLAQNYVDEYQTCEIIKTPEVSDYHKGQTVLIGNRICFSKADHFGCDAYYIDHTEVFGTVDNGVITASDSIVYIKADKTKKSKMKIGDMEFFNDTTYNPLGTKNVVQDGIVLTACKKARHSVFEYDIEVDISPGDHVYTHHFLTDTDNEREINGEMYYELAYEHLYCKVVGGEIKMLNEWNFVSPVEASNDPTEYGIILELKKKNELRVGIINHPCQKLTERGIKAGDKVFFRKGREYVMDVEGEPYYRIETNDILCKYGKMEALGDIVIVKQINESNEKNGLITTVAVNPVPEKGEVLSVGPEVGNKLSKGDVILFRKMASSEVEIEGEKVLLMKYQNVYVKV